MITIFGSPYLPKKMGNWENSTRAETKPLSWMEARSYQTGASTIKLMTTHADIVDTSSEYAEINGKAE
jgi:hypothetical protein